MQCLFKQSKLNYSDRESKFIVFIRFQQAEKFQFQLLLEQNSKRKGQKSKKKKFWKDIPISSKHFPSLNVDIKHMQPAYCFQTLFAIWRSLFFRSLQNWIFYDQVQTEVFAPMNYSLILITKRFSNI